MDPLSGWAKLAALDAITLSKARRDRAADTRDWALYEALHARDRHSHNDGSAPWNSAQEMIDNVRRLQGDEGHWLQGFGFYHQSDSGQRKTA